jgi:phytoene dehydrogenase-like protein
VTVFERRPFVGGACTTQELWPGFKFSPCAHLVHALHPKIIRDMRLRERGLEELHRGGGIAITEDLEHYWGPEDFDSPRNLTLQLTDAERESTRIFGEFEYELKRIFAPYRLGTPPTLDQVRKDIAGTPRAEMLEQALAHTQFELWDKWGFTDKLRDRFAGFLAPVGRDPNGLSLAYYSINFPEEETGERSPGGYIRGGMGAISDLMLEAATEQGVDVLTESSVKNFFVEDGRVLGVELDDGQQVRAKVTLSNLDPKRTFLKLMPDDCLTDDLRTGIESLVTEVSCYKFLAVISELPQWKAWDGDPEYPAKGGAAIHNSSFRIRSEIYDDLEAGRPPRTPIVSFSVPSAVDETLTQPGYHTASCWVFPAPARLASGTWDDVKEEVAERLIDQLNDYAPNFRDSIVHYTLRTPLDLERENGLTDGCIWHIQHNGEQLFWRRPLPELADYRAPQKGLYLCGSGQHPGGEVSGIPGHNAAHEVLKDL